MCKVIRRILQEKNGFFCPKNHPKKLFFKTAMRILRALVRGGADKKLHNRPLIEKDSQ